MNPFDVPPERWVSPSLNRVRLAGPAIPADLQGTAAYDLLSTRALRASICAAAPALAIPPDLPDPELLAALEERFSAADAPIRAAAGALAEAYGRGLAYLLLTLRHAARLSGSSAGNQPEDGPGGGLRAEVRADWQPRHWQFWSQMDGAVAGGGLLAGRLGQEMLPAARAALQDGDDRSFNLELAARPRELVLLGAARYAPPGCRVALVFDFGATAVKRAVVAYHGEQLAQVTQLPAGPSPCGQEPHGSALSASPARQLQQMARLMAATWQAAREAGLRPEPVFCVALATYLYRAQPYPQEVGSCYGRLQPLGHLQGLLTEAVARQLGMGLEMRLVHDGTAAASVFAGQSRRVVITLGTAIGHGFPPSGGGLRPLSPVIAYTDL